MPTRMRRSRSLQDEVPQPEPEVIQAGEGEIDPDLPAQMIFFSKLKRIPPAEWNNHIVYIYRLEPRVRNSGPVSNIGTFTAPFDEREIRALHGGGKYQAILKNTETDRAISKCTFELEGPPKFLPGQTILADNSPSPAPASAAVPSGAPNSAQPALNEHVLGEILSKAITAIQQQKMPADEAIKSALDTLSQAQRGAMEIVLNAAKSQSQSTTGHPMMDKVFERVLTKMVDGEEQRRNPMEEFKTMLQTVRELQGLTGENAAPQRRGGMIEEAKAVAELLKSDNDGTIKSFILGSRDADAEPASGWGQLFAFLGKAIERRPDIIDHVANGLGRLANAAAAPRIMPPQRPVTITPALTGTSTEAPDAVPGETAADTNPPLVQTSATPPQAISEQQVIEGILMAVANGYRGNYDGEAVAKSIKVLYPKAIELMRQYMNYPDSLVLGFLRNQAPLAPIVDNDDFTEFFANFKAGIMADDEIEESDDAAEQSHGAAASGSD